MLYVDFGLGCLVCLPPFKRRTVDALMDLELDRDRGALGHPVLIVWDLGMGWLMSLL
jgi:hypothetical protein